MDVARPNKHGYSVLSRVADRKLDHCGVRSQRVGASEFYQGRYSPRTLCDLDYQVVLVTDRIRLPVALVELEAQLQGMSEVLSIRRR